MGSNSPPKIYSLRFLKEFLKMFFLFFALFALASVLWIKKYFPFAGAREIVFFMVMPHEGTSTQLVGNFLKINILIPFIGVVLLFLFSSDRYFKTLWIVFFGETPDFPAPMSFSRACRWVCKKTFFIILLLFVGTGYYADQSFRIAEYLSYVNSSTDIYDRHYLDPAFSNIHFPEKKKNLVLVFLESMETTYFAKNEGGLFDENLIPELKILAEENINFSHNHLIGGAERISGGNITTAALVSHLLGIPLMVGVGDHFHFTGSAEFLPGAMGITDVLRSNGYKIVFLIGSDKKFGGRDIFFATHGEATIKDFKYYKENGMIPRDYFVWWGFEDQKLYRFAKEEITALSESKEPFALIVLTVDTHHIDGYVCALCGKRYAEQYKNVLSCASKQASEFVRWMQVQSFYENTVVVLTGDHLYGDPEFFPGTVSYDERHVFNLYINSAKTAAHKKNRRFSTLDTFPTILDAMGATYDGPGLALGRSLFRDSPTLIEKYGADYLNAELEKKSLLYDRFLYGK